MKLQFPRFSIDEHLWERAVEPEKAHAKAEKAAQQMTHAYLAKLAREGKVLDIKSGDSFEVDGVRYEFE